MDSGYIVLETEDLGSALRDYINYIHFGVLKEDASFSPCYLG